MNIFHNAKIKLTAWYLVIIMIVSLSFSFFVYRNIISEVNRGFRIRSLRTSFITDQYLSDDQLLYQEIRRRIITQIALINGIIFVLSATAGYVLAGKTLQPIEQIMEDQKRFIGDASHELRTPLTTLKTEIEVSLRDKKLTLSDAKKLLESNLEEVNKMQFLTNYLLSLSQYEDGSKKIQKEKVDIDELVQNQIEKFRLIASSKGIKITKKGKSGVINANKVSIEELISILLDNAIKYSKEKGIIKVIISQSSRSISLSVTDSGVGIKASDIEYVFNRFYRADMSRAKTKVAGYGLGLAIAKSIVSMHKGKIEVKSKVGVGSTFSFTLPK